MKKKKRIIDMIREAKAPPPTSPPGQGKKKFNLQPEAALASRGTVKASGKLGFTLPIPFNLEGTPVGEGMFAVYAVRGKLLGTLKVKGELQFGKPAQPFDLVGAGGELVVFDLEGVPETIAA